MEFRIVGLAADCEAWVEQTAALLHEAFRGRTGDWQDLESARREVLESLAQDKISRVAIDEAGRVVGWIGAIPMYEGRVWEIHPLVVSARHRRQGVGRALVRDLEDAAGQRGVLTLWAGSDDEHHETTLGGTDLYEDIPGAIRGARSLKGHPFEFYIRIGFTIVGVMPDANGPGKPDIFLARRVGRSSPS